MELKDVIDLTSSEQLKAQLRYATSNEIPYSLVVSPSNKTISAPLWDAIEAAGGKVYQFNPANQTITPITVRPK